MCIIELNCVNLSVYNTKCMCVFMFECVCLIYHVMWWSVPVFIQKVCMIWCIIWCVYCMISSWCNADVAFYVFKDICAAVSCDIILMMSYLLYSMDGHPYIMHVTVLIETLIRPINRQWSALHIMATLIYLQSWLDMELIRKLWIMYV